MNLVRFFFSRARSELVEEFLRALEDILRQAQDERRGAIIDRANLTTYVIEAKKRIS